MEEHEQRTPPLRRDRREQGAAIVLPAAPPVLRSTRAGSVSSARAKRRAGVLALGLAVIGAVFIVGGGFILVGGHDALRGDHQAVPQGHAIAAEGPCLTLVTAEAGAASACRAPASNAEKPGTDVGGGGPTPRATDQKGAQTPDRVTDRTDSTSNQGTNDPSEPDSTSPDDTDPTPPDQPETPTDFEPPQPPVPPQPPEPPQPPLPPTPAPLGFTGISENTTIGLLGIRVLSSYTLALSGEPGQTATVWYGSVRAGTVTFGEGGQSAITLGRSLVDLGLGNPLIRASYSDGSGEIQAYRNSI